MFKELQPIVARGNVAMMLATEGDQLRVTIHQKEPKGAALPINLSIVASPEELDRDLPEAIAKASGQLPPGKPVADQVAEQTAASEAKSDKDYATKQQKKAAAIGKAAAQKTAKKKTMRPVKPVRVAKTKPAPKAKRPAPAKPAKPAKPTTAAPAGRATAEECLAEFKTLYAKHGNELNRELFLKHAKTARSFERRFGGWKQFVAAAGFTATAGAEKTDPPVDNRALDLPLEPGAGGVVSADPSSPIPATIEETTGEPVGERLVTADDPEVLAIAAGTNTDPEEVARGLNEATYADPAGNDRLPDTWPFPTTESAPQQDGTDASDVRADASPAADADTTITTAQVSGAVELTERAPAPANDAAQATSQDSGPDTEPAAVVSIEEPRPARTVRRLHGHPIEGLTLDDEVDIGDVMVLPGFGKARVVEFTDEEIVVERVEKRVAAAEGAAA